MEMSLALCENFDLEGLSRAEGELINSAKR